MGTRNVYIEDAVGVSDSASKAAAFSISLQDSMAAVDMATSFELGLSDDSTVSDSTISGLIFGRTPSDTVSVTDSTATDLSYSRELSDSIVIVDMATTFDIGLSDSILLTESLSGLLVVVPEGWPPRPAEGRRTIRVNFSGTGTADYADNAYLFNSVVGANTMTPSSYVPQGSTATVTTGDLTRGGSPSGGSRDARDANPVAAPVAMLWCNTLLIHNDGGGDLTFSFDGINVHGVVKTGQSALYRQRMEAGIALKGAGVAFRVEAW